MVFGETLLLDSGFVNCRDWRIQCGMLSQSLFFWISSFQYLSDGIWRGDEGLGIRWYRYILNQYFNWTMEGSMNMELFPLVWRGFHECGTTPIILTSKVQHIVWPFDYRILSPFHVDRVLAGSLTTSAAEMTFSDLVICMFLEKRTGAGNPWTMLKTHIIAQRGFAQDSRTDDLYTITAEVAWTRETLISVVSFWGLFAKSDRRGACLSLSQPAAAWGN